MTVIVKGSSVDDALTKAMIELGVSSDNIEYKVLSEAKNGFLGIGAKQCEIEAWKKEDKAEASPKEKTKEKVKNEKEKEVKIQVSNKENKEIVEGLQEAQENVFEFNSKKQVKNFEKTQMTRNPEEVIQKAKDFLEPIFKQIDIVPEIEAIVDKDDNVITLNLKGKNMGVLIGKHGVTIDALQHLVSLIVNQNEKDKVRIRIDSENYRDKREETLSHLAHSVAQKVRKTKKAIALEPMSAYERRIIHSTLQKERNIETISEGEDKYRHVVVKFHR